MQTQVPPRAIAHFAHRRRAMMRPVRKCAVPACPRKDLEHDRALCPGHHILWERSIYRYDARVDAVEAWIQSLLKGPTHTNGVS